MPVNSGMEIVDLTSSSRGNENSTGVKTLVARWMLVDNTSEAMNDMRKRRILIPEGRRRKRDNRSEEYIIQLTTMLYMLNM